MTGFDNKTSTTNTKIDVVIPQEIKAPIFSGFNTGTTTTPFKGFDLGENNESADAGSGFRFSTSMVSADKNEDKSEESAKESNATEDAEPVSY